MPQSFSNRRDDSAKESVADSRCIAAHPRDGPTGWTAAAGPLKAGSHLPAPASNLHRQQPRDRQPVERCLFPGWRRHCRPYTAFLFDSSMMPVGTPRRRQLPDCRGVSRNETRLTTDPQGAGAHRSGRRLRSRSLKWLWRLRLRSNSCCEACASVHVAAPTQYLMQNSNPRGGQDFLNFTRT